RLASASEPTGGAPTAEGRNRTSSSLGVNAGPLPRPKGRTNAGSTARAPRVFAASGRAARGKPAGAAYCPAGRGGAANNLAKVTGPEIGPLRNRLVSHPPPQALRSGTGPAGHKVRIRGGAGGLRPPYSRGDAPRYAPGAPPQGLTARRQRG